MIELFNIIVSYMAENFDVLFSGAGVTIITLICSVIVLIVKKIYKTMISRSQVAEDQAALPPKLLEPEGKKNQLKVPVFRLIRTKMGFTGGHKPVKNYEFKVTNSGGKAFNVSVSGSMLKQSIELQDINRHSSKSFILAFGGSELPQEIVLEIKCLDGEEDTHRQVIRLHLVGTDYIAT